MEQRKDWEQEVWEQAIINLDQANTILMVVHSMVLSLVLGQLLVIL